MHEMSVAQNIFEIMQQYVPVHEARDVRSVKLRIGDLAGVVSESLEFCFSVLADGTSFRGATLDIEHIPLTFHCKACDSTSKRDMPVFVCPSCKSSDIDILSGMELQVVEIVLQDQQKDSS